MKVGIKFGKVKKFGIGWCILHRMAADNAKGGSVRTPPPLWYRVKLFFQSRSCGHDKGFQSCFEIGWQFIISTCTGPVRSYAVQNRNCEQQLTFLSIQSLNDPLCFFFQNRSCGHAKGFESCFEIGQQFIVSTCHRPSAVLCPHQLELIQ